MFVSLPNTSAATPLRPCDAMKMRSQSFFVAALVLGSETNKVLTHSKIPVLVCR